MTYTPTLETENGFHPKLKFDKHLINELIKIEGNRYNVKTEKVGAAHTKEGEKTHTNRTIRKIVILVF